MPISFQAPQPFAPGISQQAGAAQVEQANNATLASLYEAAGRNRQAAANSEADRFARNNQVGQQLGEQAQQHADDLQLRKDQFQASLNPHARDVFAAQVGEAQARQHMEAQAWVHQQDFTFQDDLRLKNQQSAVAEVQRAHDAHEITDEEFTDFVMKLRTGIDPARQRQERALAQQQEAHAKQYLSQANLVAQSEIETAAAAKKAAEAGHTTIIHRDPHSGISELWFWDPKKSVWYNPSTTAGGAKGGAAEKPVTRFGDDHGEFSFALAKKEAMAIAEAKVPVVPEYGADGKMTKKDKNAEERAQVFQEEIGKMQADHFRKHGGAAPAGSAGGDPGPGSGQIPPPPAAPPKPFDSYEKASPQQKGQLDLARAQVENVRRLDIPEHFKDEYAKATDVATELLRKYGDISEAAMAGMAPADRAKLTEARLTIQSIEDIKGGVRFRQTPPAAPTPGLVPPSTFRPAPSSSFRPTARRS